MHFAVSIELMTASMFPQSKPKWAMASPQCVAAVNKATGQNLSRSEVEEMEQDANEMLAAHADARRLTPDDVASVKRDDLNSHAETLAKAYQAAAACLASGGLRLLPNRLAMTEQRPFLHNLN
jgi:hypothetical protein